MAGSFPPVVMVSFDPERAAPERILQAGKIALETDPFDDSPVTVTLAFGPVAAPSAQEPIHRYTAAELWVATAGADTLRLNSELLSCGSCGNQVLDALRSTPGVLEASAEGDFRTGVTVTVRYDPSVTATGAIAGIAKGALESDPFLPTSVTVQMLPE